MWTAFVLLAVGVGSKKPPSKSAVRRSHMACTEAESWRDSVAQPSKVSPGFGECGQRNVLCKDEGRPALGDDAGHLGPEVALVGGTLALAGDTPRLAGEAAADDIDSSAPRPGVKGSDVVMDWERFEDAFALSCLEDAPAVRVDLDSADAAVAQQQAAQDAAANAGEEMQFAQNHP